MSSKAGKSKPSIRMVAEHVQLSPATVSLALRGSPSIAATTRARVLAAARDLNYLPVQHEERPSRKAGAHLLFVTRDLGDRPVTANPFYGQILAAAERECASQGARLTFVLLSDQEESGPQSSSIFGMHQPDGVLLVGSYPPAIVTQVSIKSKGPVVLVDNLVPGLACDSVMADDFGGAQLAIQHLLELGHRHIGAFVGQLTIPSLAARYRSYRAVCREAGLDAAPPTEFSWERSQLRAAVQEILAREPKPTAIFCVTDTYAVFVLDLLRDFGLRVPDDISVVGFDNLPIARMTNPPLTTVQNHPEVLGRLGVQRLLARLSSDNDPGLSISVTTHLIVRESTRAL